MINDIQYVYIAREYALAIVNADCSELADYEEAELNRFLQRFVYAYGYHITLGDDMDTDFRRCEVSSLMADCVEMRIYEVIWSLGAAALVAAPNQTQPRKHYEH